MYSCVSQKQTGFFSTLLFVQWKASGCLCTAGELRSMRGHLQRLDAKGRTQPPARPKPSKLVRPSDFRGWDSGPGIHPEPTLKTDDARLRWPWRSNGTKMQAVNQEGFAMRVFNYWHFQRCKSVLLSQQEKIHLNYPPTGSVSSVQGFSLHQHSYSVTKNKMNPAGRSKVAASVTEWVKQSVRAWSKPLQFFWLTADTGFLTAGVWAAPFPGHHNPDIILCELEEPVVLWSKSH